MKRLTRLPALSATFVAVSTVYAQSVVLFTSEHSARGVVYNMTFAPPLTNPQDGYGMACADLDGDDDLDLVFLGRADGLVGFYENNGVGVFINRSATSGIPATTSGAGIVAIDYDRDGDLDLFIAQKNGPCRLLRHNAPFQFTDIAAAAGVNETLPATGVSSADFDGDGWLDIHVSTYSAVVPNRLYRNLGNGTFVDVAASLGVASTGLSYQSVWSDYNRDSWPDLCVSNDRGFGNVPNQLHRNLANGTFADVSSSSGLNVALCSMGIACADLTGDGYSDYYFTNVPDPTPPLNGVNPLMIGSAKGVFTQADALWGVSNIKYSWAAIFFDFDNDADLDLYVNNEFVPNALYRIPGAPPMTDIATAAGVAGNANLSYCSIVGDLDRDGDEDLLLNNYGGPVRLFMNQDGQQRASSGFALRAKGACATQLARRPRCERNSRRANSARRSGAKCSRAGTDSLGKARRRCTSVWARRRAQVPWQVRSSSSGPRVVRRARFQISLQISPHIRCGPRIRRRALVTSMARAS